MIGIPEMDDFDCYEDEDERPPDETDLIDLDEELARALGDERTAALRCIGNGVVPATAFRAFRELRRPKGKVSQA